LSSPSSRQTVREQPLKQKILGTRKSSEVTLKPGVPIVKKSVVHIDNLDPDCSEALLKDYLLSDDISVLSCYKAKSWLRQDEKDKVTAFRVCVPLTQREKLFDPQRALSSVTGNLRKPILLQLVAWLSGRTSVFRRRTFPVLRSTCS